MQSATKFRAGIVGFALTFYLLMQLIKQFPSFIETYYSTGLYPILTLIMSNISGQFGFSVTEFAIWFIILVGIPFTIARIRRKRRPIGRVLLNIVVLTAILYVWFYAMWGLNYFREPLSYKLELYKVKPTAAAFDSAFVEIIENCNNLSFTYSPQTVQEITTAIDSSYKEVMAQLGLPDIPGYKGAKTFAFNWLLNKATVSGWFSPFFHEVHYNTDLLIFELPFIIAHEKAHQKGFTSESEANFLAYLVCVNTREPLCQYSANFEMLAHFMRSLRQNPDKQKSFQQMLSRGVQFNRKEVYERWLSHQGVISEVSRRSYDFYLKSNNVPEGVSSYSKVVDLLVRYREATKVISE